MATWQDLNVDHGSAVPLHTQLQRQIHNLIHSGHWAPGSRLPSETQLQRNLNISRNTVRQALREIESEGLIERIPGRGSFVAREFPSEKGETLVAFIVGQFESELDMLSAAERMAREKDCLLVFYSHRGDYREEQRLLRQLVEQKVSGVLLWSCRPAGARGSLQEELGLTLPPLVMVDRDTPGLLTDFITSDNVGGARLAVGHLRELGHRRIICLSHSRNDLLPVAERIQGYHGAMAEAGDAAAASTWVLPTGGELPLAEVLRLSQDLDNPTMREFQRRLQEERPEAIFAINDHVACLALRAAQMLGWQVPGDLSIVGYDNVIYGSFFTPPLTTIVQDYGALGRGAMELLVQRMADRSLPARNVRVPVTLNNRATTGSPSDHS